MDNKRMKAQRDRLEAARTALVDVVGHGQDYEREADKEQELRFSQSPDDGSVLTQSEATLQCSETEEYGVCSNCGNEILAKRLELPWARYCLTCQNLAERGLLTEAEGHDAGINPESDTPTDELEKRDKALAQAYESRELAAAQTDEDWLGMKLLAYLRKSPDSQVSELAVMTGAPVDAVAPVLARLTRAGAVAVRQRQFACTEKGTEILKTLETATGISLTP